MNTQRLKILLIEDDEDDYIIVRQILSQARGIKFDLIWAPTYEAGLGQFDQNDFSVILVDYSLGLQTGLDFIQAATEKNNLAPIILLTGQGNYEVDLRAMKAGAVDYLTKGEVTAPLLERSIRYAIERKQTELQLRREAERSALLSNLSRDFSEAGLDFMALINTITRRTSETFGDAIIIRILAEDGQTLEPAAIYHPNPTAREMMADLLFKSPQMVGQGLVGEVAQTQTARLVCEAPLQELVGITQQEFLPWFEQFPVDSIYAVPLCVHSNLIGTLTAVRNTPGGIFAEDDQSFYLDLANRAAMAIENARLHNKIELLAMTDTLTGLYNRRGFYQFGKREFDRYQRYGHPLSLIMMDIDHFKRVNDTYGHAFGDEVLKALSDSCTAATRRMDIACRYGGDEFIILLPETNLHTAVLVAQRILECFSKRPFLYQEQKIHLTASLGVTHATADQNDLDILVKKADIALYAAKQKGRNQVEVG